MSLSENAILKSNSLSLQIKPNNIRTGDRNPCPYRINGCVLQNNISNQSSSQKSLKDKILYFFKSSFKQNKLSAYSTTATSITKSLTQNSSQIVSTRPNVVTTKTVIEKPEESLKENVNKRFDSGDKRLVTEFQLHQFTESIIDFVNLEHCSVIRLPRNLTSNNDIRLTNKSLKPFLTTIPGLIGLKNHHNTCYVNVIIQCLSCIDSVSEYFVTKDYLDNLRQSPENNESPQTMDSATDIDVLVSFAYLLQSLWQLTYNPNISLKFYQLLTLNKPQFRIDSQQDAHEFLLYILNLLHDNLVEPATESTDGASSFIFDKFRGWMSDVITCPQCGYSRTCTDQMLSLNLQIPKDLMDDSELMDDRLFSIIVTDISQVTKKHAFEIDKTTTVADIRAQIAERVVCEPYDIIVLELLEFGFGNLFSDSQLIVDIYQKNNYLSMNTNDNFEDGLYAIHMPNHIVDVDAIPTDIQSLDELSTSTKRSNNLRSTLSFVRLLIVHVEKTKFCALEYMSEISDELRQTLNMDTKDSCPSKFNSRLSSNQKHFCRFTNVFTVQAASKTKMSLLRHSLSEQMCKYLNLRNITKLPKPQFIIEGSHLISELDTFPLLHSSVDEALKHSAEICGQESAVVRLVVVWPYRTTEILKFNKRTSQNFIREIRFPSINSHKISLHSSVEELTVKRCLANSLSSSIKTKKEKEITIYDCLKEFFSLDSVSETESWNCPGCATTQKAYTNIRIKESPEILVIMLKKFTIDQTPKPNDKNVNATRPYPRAGSLTSSFSKKFSSTNDFLNKLECFIEYPLENLNMEPYMENATDDENYLYDLVGVVNHMGNLSNGHYVAICRSPIDNQWRLYDDDRITEISKTDVIHPDAYILFYKRQSSAPDLNTESDIHWSYRRLLFPDKFHRNQSPNPTNLYSKNRRFSEKIPTALSNENSAVELAVSNNHNMILLLPNRLGSINKCTVSSRPSIASPHLSSSSSSSSNSTSSLTRVTDTVTDNLVTSTILDQQSDSPKSFSEDHRLERDISNGSDSGTVLSPVSSCPTNCKTSRTDNDSYSSLSSSPSTSSFSASKNKNICDT